MKSRPTSSLKDIVRRDNEGSVTFGEFVDAWNYYFSENNTLDFELEALTENFLSNAARPNNQHVTGPQIRRMLSSFPNPALLVGPGGIIVSSNVKAVDSFGLDIDASINDLPYALEGGNTISGEIWLRSRDKRRAGAVTFLNAFSQQQEVFDDSANGPEC